MSSLKRFDEVVVPSLLDESITTGTASGLTTAPRTFPMKQLLFTLDPARLAPIQITLLAVVTPVPAFVPKAILLAPVVLWLSALLPRAVLKLPVVFPESASRPTAVFALPVLLF